MARFLLALLLAALSPWVLAGVAQPLAADPVLEARVTKMAEELRCLVCQNQTIADSNAPLANDLKNQVREMLAAGRSEREVVEYMTARYGDFVLYRPPVKATTLLLWVGPLVLLLASLIFLFRHIRRAARETPAAEPAADPEAARRAEALLGLSRKESA